MYAEAELKSLLDLAHQAGAQMTVVLDQKLYEKEGREVIDIVTIHSGIPGIGRHPASGFAMCEALRAAKAKGYLGPVFKTIDIKQIPGTYEYRISGVMTTGETSFIGDYDPLDEEFDSHEFINLTRREAYAHFQHKMERAQARQPETMRG